MPLFPPRISLTGAGVLAFGWLFLVTVLAARFNIPSADGILYSLPFATARHPFDLGIPFLDGFGGYDSSWGHHWPGSMWLKGLLFSVLPYSREADVVFLSLFQLLVATAAATAVRSFTSSRWLAGAVWLLLLSDRLLLLACAGNRFESIAVATVVGWFSLAFAKKPPLSAASIWTVRAAAFLSAASHPYSLALGAIIAAFDLVRSKQQGLPMRESAIRLGFFLSGCIAIVSWFVLQPDALNQFIANALIQKSFYHNWNTVVSGLGNYQLGSGLLLWGAALAASVALAGRLVPIPSTAGRADAFRFLGPALLVAVIAIHTITRCENFTYLAFGTPFAAMIVAVFVGSVQSQPSTTAAKKIVNVMPAAVFLLILLFHMAILPYRVLQFTRAGRPDLKSELSGILAGLPPDKTVYIPHLMWPAACREKDRSIRWFTFPIASSLAVRREYEGSVYSKAKAGDFLIVDNLAAAGVDRFGVHPTFPVLPPDPRRWEPYRSRKLLFPGSTPWGLDLTIYRFTGNN